MRIDKFLCEMNAGTRRQVKEFIKQGRIRVNDDVIKSPDIKINEKADRVYLDGKLLAYEEFHYFMLNKPQGVVSATKDNFSDTVVQLIHEEVKNLFPVGRLDKDTEGLLLVTDDGELAHRLLSPGRHVDKTYFVKTFFSLEDGAKEKLEQGVDIGDDKPTLPARVEMLSPNEMLLTIHEGRFHQIKRMFKAVDNEVAALKRISFGRLKLDEGLKPGEYRRLTDEEVFDLHES